MGSEAELSTTVDRALCLAARVVSALGLGAALAHGDELLALGFLLFLAGLALEGAP